LTGRLSKTAPPRERSGAVMGVGRIRESGLTARFMRGFGKQIVNAQEPAAHLHVRIAGSLALPILGADRQRQRTFAQELSAFHRYPLAGGSPFVRGHVCGLVPICQTRPEPSCHPLIDRPGFLMGARGGRAGKRCPGGVCADQPTNDEEATHQRCSTKIVVLLVA